MTSRAAFRAWDTMREREDRVIADLPPDLVPLWHRVRSGIRGETPHAKVEAFLQYAHENPSEIADALQASADRQLGALLAAARPDHVKRQRIEAARKAVETRAKRRVGKAR
jgi:hypothetical protein